MLARDAAQLVVPNDARFANVASRSERKVHPMPRNVGHTRVNEVTTTVPSKIFGLHGIGFDTYTIPACTHIKEEGVGNVAGKCSRHIDISSILLFPEEGAKTSPDW